MRLPQKEPLIFFLKLGRFDGAVLSLPGVSGLVEEPPLYESPDALRSRGDWLDGRLRLVNKVRMLLPLDLLLPGEGVIGCGDGDVSVSVVCMLGSAASGEDEWVSAAGYAPGVVGYAPGMEYVEFCKKKSGVPGRP